MCREIPVPESQSGQVEMAWQLGADNVEQIKSTGQQAVVSLIDEVLAELLSCSLGLIARSETLTPRLHAVDWTITANAEPL